MSNDELSYFPCHSSHARFCPRSFKAMAWGDFSPSSGFSNTRIFLEIWNNVEYVLPRALQAVCGLMGNDCFCHYWVAVVGKSSRGGEVLGGEGGGRGVNLGVRLCLDTL